MLQKNSTANVLIGATVALILITCAASIHAQPALDLPIQCVPNQSCWIANLPDLDPGPAATDFTCGRMTYDKHNGTDFAVRDLSVMNAGVNVLAAAKGKVVSTRDALPDQNIRLGDKADIKDRECGNGVLIDHGGGWATQYCHMKLGSVAVKPGTIVETGAILGQVGLSGNTEYPHLHFVVHNGNRILDPFVGIAIGENCHKGSGDRHPLWNEATLKQLP
jgi:murein DD-endopeptidase MepM/ murein hydrolase activator NlpD